MNRLPFFIYFCCTPDAYGCAPENPIRRQKLPRGGLSFPASSGGTRLSARAATAAVVTWTVLATRRPRPAFLHVSSVSEEDPGSPLICAPLISHRNYFQRQPEHVEDEFMHHNRKNEFTSMELVPVSAAALRFSQGRERRMSEILKIKHTFRFFF